MHNFIRVCKHVTDFNTRSKYLTAKLLQQGYIGIINFENHFPNFMEDTINQFPFDIGLKTLLREGLSEPEVYGDLVYKFKKLIGRNDVSFQFRKIIMRYKRTCL